MLTVTSPAETLFRRSGQAGGGKSLIYRFKESILIGSLGNLTSHHRSKEQAVFIGGNSVCRTTRAARLASSSGKRAKTQALQATDGGPSRVEREQRLFRLPGGQRTCTHRDELALVSRAGICMSFAVGLLLAGRGTEAAGAALGLVFAPAVVAAL